MSGENVTHRCKVRFDPDRWYFAYCKPRRGRCGWKGHKRTSLLAAYGDALSHDPLFPQGDTAAERKAV